MSDNPLFFYAKLWSLGWITMAFMVGLPMLYLAGRLLRNLGAWFERETGPRDRALAKVAIFAVFGLLLGGIAQGYAHGIEQCLATGLAPAHCLVNVGQ